MCVCRYRDIDFFITDVKNAKAQWRSGSLLTQRRCLCTPPCTGFLYNENEKRSDEPDGARRRPSTQPWTGGRGREFSFVRNTERERDRDVREPSRRRVSVSTSTVSQGGAATTAFTANNGAQTIRWNSQLFVLSLPVMSTVVLWNSLWLGDRPSQRPSGPSIWPDLSWFPFTCPHLPFFFYDASPSPSPLPL